MSYDGGRTWADVDDVAITMPGAVVRVATLAADLGWSWSVSFAPGPPLNVVLRFAKGTRRAFAGWKLADDRCAFQGGAANRLPGGHLRTLASVKAYLAESDDA